MTVGTAKGGGWREQCLAGTFDSVIATVQNSLSGSLYSSNETSRIEVYYRTAIYHKICNVYEYAGMHV